MEIQKPRAKLYPRLVTNFNVVASTFGSPVSYRLKTINISKNGLLTGSKVIIPFQVNTLLEMLIDPNGEFLPKPVNCIGKVVRLAKEARPEQDVYNLMFGIAISETSEENFRHWETYLN